MRRPIRKAPPLYSWLLGALMLTCSTPARDLFTFKVSVDQSPVVSKGVNDIRYFLELFDDVSLGEDYPNYNPDSSVVAIVDARGIKGILTYLPNSQELRLTLPQLGLDLRFPGRTREESQEMMEDWFKGDLDIAGSATTVQLKKLLHVLAKYSPVEPIAGNPNSLQSRMFMADFDRATLSPRVQLSGLPPDVGKPKGAFYVDADYGAVYRADAFDIYTVSLSLGGVINFQNRHWAMLLDWPFMGSWTENAESIFTYPGLGVQYRVTDWWDLTAFGRAGIGGSWKVGALGGIYSGTLTSYLHHDFGNISVGWGLLGGFSHTIDDIEIANYNITYGLLNYPLQTGLNFSGPLGFNLGSKSAGWSFYGNYTHLFGTDLFLEDFYELGAGFLLRTEARGTRTDWMRLRVGYLFGKDYQGLSTSLTFNF